MRPWKHLGHIGQQLPRYMFAGAFPEYLAGIHKDINEKMVNSEVPKELFSDQAVLTTKP
jgi:hypothetical protein